ncbi:SEC-C domain-containing protein [Phytohabitans rumicis]|uniref:SEC-C motif-containing protein n=1 Tax=Phytohabitans rumicis TaxID=1076125 RepID=A0A6V8LBU4_9ACTN|nr:SEC-C domain-containing protein [Phytohabitans rumicis]GFJ93100.1 hypothetical protein Prum_067420 [Phytohabitans rumicis]
MNPLATFARNDRCWCGAGIKYKQCHGAIRPLSIPGESITRDDGDGDVWIAPHTKVTINGLHISPNGVGLTLPTGRPEARPVDVPPAVKTLLDVSAPTEVLTLPVLGRHRFDLYEHAGFRSGHTGDRDLLADAISGLSVAVMHALAAMGRSRQSQPTVLWNDDTEATRLLGQTLLWADHVCVADRVFDAIVNDRSDDALADALAHQERLRPLVEAGVVVPVPQELGVAAQATAVEQMTARDLRRAALVDWVRLQLVVEGPTAREAMLVTARDDTERWPRFWLYSRRGGEATARASMFGRPLLGTYDPNHNYEPWRQQVLDQATAWYVQRLNERLVTGETFTADYLTASPFEARLLARKGHCPTVRRTLRSGRTSPSSPTPTRLPWRGRRPRTRPWRTCAVRSDSPCVPHGRSAKALTRSPA